MRWVVASISSVPPTGDEAGRDATRVATRKRILAWSIAALLLAVLIATAPLFLPGSSEDRSRGRFVAVFLTDLPGDFESLVLDLAAATVGDFDDPLTIEVSRIEISAIQDPHDAPRVASGFVPWDTGTRVAMIFDRAEGYKDGAWHRLDMPKNRLILEQGIPTGDFGSNAALFDLNLDASLVEMDGRIVFQPVVQTVYQAHGQDAADAWDPREELEKFIQIQLPQQQLDFLSRDIVERLCERMNACQPTPAPASGGPAPPSNDQRQANPSPGPGRGNANLANLAPTALIEPAPANAATKLGLSTALSWGGGADPEGGAVTFRTLVNGVERCAAQATRSCGLNNLLNGTTYRWKVVAEDASGGQTHGPEWVFTTSFPTLLSLEAPLDQATGQEVLLWLDWAATDQDDPALSYRVLIGEQNPPTTILCDGVPETRCQAPDLDYTTTYYWRVVVYAGLDQVAGPVWSFETKENQDGGSDPLGQRLPS